MSVPSGNEMDKHEVHDVKHTEASNTEMPLAAEKANSRLGGGPKPMESNDRKVSSWTTPEHVQVLKRKRHPARNVDDPVCSIGTHKY